MRVLEVLLAIVGIVAGVWLILLAYLPQGLSSGPHVHLEVRPRVSAHRLGLAHRLAARLLLSRARPRDVDFALLERYTTDVDTRYVGSIAFATPGVIGLRAAAQAGAPLLELEQLLERLERFTARVRSWRPGRRRERS